jgi:hypothetical protein
VKSDVRATGRPRHRRMLRGRGRALGFRADWCGSAFCGRSGRRWCGCLQ